MSLRDLVELLRDGGPWALVAILGGVVVALWRRNDALHEARLADAKASNHLALTLAERAARVLSHVAGGPGAKQ